MGWKSADFENENEKFTAFGKRQKLKNLGNGLKVPLINWKNDLKKEKVIFEFLKTVEKREF